MFTCDTPLATDGRHGRADRGQRRQGKALLKEAGYDGTPVVIPQPTDLGVIKQLAPVAKAQLEKAGFKVEVQPMDWQSMVTPADHQEGPAVGRRLERLRHELVAARHPRSADDAHLAATCEKARAGWPCDAELEKLRDKFIARRHAGREEGCAEEVQTHAMQIVTHVPLGEWFGVGAVRARHRHPAVPPPIMVFWGMTRSEALGAAHARSRGVKLRALVEGSLSRRNERLPSPRRTDHTSGA